MRGFSRPANNIAAVAVCHIIVALLAATSAHAHLTFACAADNDLFKLCAGAKRFDTPAAAIDAAPEASGVLILADGYPRQRASLSADLLERAKQKKLRL